MQAPTEMIPHPAISRRANLRDHRQRQATKFDEVVSEIALCRSLDRQAAMLWLTELPYEEQQRLLGAAFFQKIS